MSQIDNKLIKKRKPKSDGRIVVNVSFTEAEYQLLNYADEHGNFSQYVKRLIYEDFKTSQKEVTGITVAPELLQTLFAMMNNPSNVASLQTALQEQMNAQRTALEQCLGKEQEKEKEPVANLAKVDGVLKGLKTKKDMK